MPEKYESKSALEAIIKKYGDKCRYEEATDTAEETEAFKDLSDDEIAELSAELIANLIEGEPKQFKSEGNPNHDPGNGQFTNGSKAGSKKPKDKKERSPREPKKVDEKEAKETTSKITSGLNNFADLSKKVSKKALQVSVQAAQGAWNKLSERYGTLGASAIAATAIGAYFASGTVGTTAAAASAVAVLGLVHYLSRSDVKGIDRHLRERAEDIVQRQYEAELINREVERIKDSRGSLAHVKAETEIRKEGQKQDVKEEINRQKDTAAKDAERKKNKPTAEKIGEGIASLASGGVAVASLVPTAAIKIGKYLSTHTVSGRRVFAMASPGGANTFVPDAKKRFSAEEFELIENVPIFDEHHGIEEDLDIDFNPEMLQKIIDRCNQRISDTEDYPVIIDGHTQEDGPEADVLGYACNFRMGDIGNNKPRKAIYVDMHIKKDKFSRAKELPRRSIELWHKDLTADPIVLDRAPIEEIALLGGTRPARDLGLMFSKNSTKKITSIRKYHYQMMEGTMDNQLLQEVLQAVMELPCMKWCEGQMAQQEPAKLDEPAQMEEPKEESLDKPDEGEKEDEHVGPAKLKMQFDQEKIRYAKLDNEYKTLFAKVADLERKERIADRKSVLTQLFAEGFQFDLADELEMVADYEPAKFSKHVSWIKKNFRKAPIGVDIKTVSLPEEGGSVTPPALTPRDVMLQATEKAFAKYKN